ncbi:hypothetical protein [Deinococcus cellulosilyticus]|uniref:hypothetical protein n=1 Tax=Deinococcus cellulosilyticus TaxID=401558 RepID=UPI0011BD6802|nr:hypothetical protein [Deinococcus cellulosilyticus]
MTATDEQERIRVLEEKVQELREWRLAKELAEKYNREMRPKRKINWNTVFTVGAYILLALSQLLTGKGN